jgi:arylsulfatase A-like enzyme
MDRQFLSYGILGSALAAQVSAQGAAATNPEKPNVLFLVVDDLNDWVSCYNWYKGKVYTPNIDKLASEGVLFTRAYCPVALCGPCRTAVLTGKYQYSTGIYRIEQHFRQISSTRDLVTLPQYFRKNGYIAVGSGKTFHGPNHDNCDRISWDDYSDHWFGTQRPPTNEIPHYPIPFKNTYDDIKNSYYGAIKQSLEETGDGYNAEYIADFLKQKHDKPFFAAYGCFRPHTPWFAPKEFFDLYPLDEIVLPDAPEGDLDDVPPIGRDVAYQGDYHTFEQIKELGLWKEYVRGYLACISFADACVGRVLDALEKSPYRDNTIVVLWSDHGWHLGEKEHWHKFTLWERGTRTPLIIKAPGVTPEGKRTADVTNLVDLYPTMVELCGLPPFSQVEGESLVPVLKNPDLDRNRTTVMSLPWHKDCHAIVDNRFRYIRYSDGTEELYDHKNDRTEFTNLANNPEYSDVKRRLKKKLLETVR